MPPKKFVTLNFRPGSDYLNADWLFDLVFSYYITKFNAKSCRHVSLSVGPFTAYVWNFGNTEFPQPGTLTPLSTQDMNLIRAFIKDGAGLIYQEFVDGVPEFPGIPADPIRNTLITPYPNLNLNSEPSFEDFVNAACKRMTASFDPIDGKELPPVTGRLYGIDATHEYLMKIEEEGHPTVQHKAVICRDNLVNWWAAWLCGVERGEFGGPCPFGPNTLPSDLTETHSPEDIWLASYVDDFAETPFYFICGLQSFIPIKNLGEYDLGDPRNDSEVTNLDEMRVDADGNIWCYFTMVERAQWLYNYLKNVSPIAAKRIGAFITSRSCHSAQYNWLNALASETQRKDSHYEKFNILPGAPYKPTNLEEAHLAASQMGDNDGEYGFWKAQFEAWLDYIAQYWMTDSDIILLSDREAKDMVVQQYDLTTPPITVDATRLQMIVEYLVNRNNWIDTDEWETTIVVTRPKNYIKITVEEEDEYYSLSEAYWHMLSALNDIANGASITAKALEPVIGPCEPNICPKTSVPEVTEEDSVYRIFAWWQNNSEQPPTILAQEILNQANALFNQAKTALVGPTYPTDRRVNLRKVVTFWNIRDKNDNTIKTNAAEMLYLMAKTLDYYYNPTNPNHFTFLPSHVLPIGYFTFLNNGRFKNIFGQENQLAWLDLGQRWTLKPAILQSSYR